MTATDDTTESTERRDRRSVWIRGAFMLFFLIAIHAAHWLLGLVALIQFVTLLITGKQNGFLADFGRSLGAWLDQVARFQSAASEDRPFPWAPWPQPR